MGRIEHNGSTLVDINTAKTILNKSRRTIFYLIRKSKLSPIRVEGSKKAWFEISQVRRLAQVSETGGGPDTKSRAYIDHLRRFHPSVLKPDNH